MGVWGAGTDLPSSPGGGCLNTITELKHGLLDTKKGPCTGQPDRWTGSGPREEGSSPISLGDKEASG